MWGFCGSMGVNEQTRGTLTISAGLGPDTTTLPQLECSLARVQRAEGPQQLLQPPWRQASIPAGHAGLTQAGWASLKARVCSQALTAKPGPHQRGTAVQQTLQARWRGTRSVKRSGKMRHQSTCQSCAQEVNPVIYGINLWINDGIVPLPTSCALSTHVSLNVIWIFFF